MVFPRTFFFPWVNKVPSLLVQMCKEISKNYPKSKGSHTNHIIWLLSTSQNNTIYECQ